jgi:hypothetical protein
MRLRYAQAGRARIEQHFRIEHTVAPLIELLEKAPGMSRSRRPVGDARASHSEATTEKIAYLIDRWPDKDLPLLERELEEMRQRNLPIIPFVCELDSAARLTQSMERLAPRLEYLPDAMVIEAEWRANLVLAQKFEEMRAQQRHRTPGSVFLRQARFALALRRPLLEKRISHVHATSSRALVCALILREIADVTVSATIERRPQLPRNWIVSALQKCKGGRVSDRKLLGECGESFLFDKAARRSFWVPQGFWQKWAESLEQWCRNNRSSKIENRK